MRVRAAAWASLAVLCGGSAPAHAQTALRGATITITRAAGKITIDGKLDDEGWQHATVVDKWYETNPGDNIEPPVRSVGHLTYDDRYLYVGLEFDDPTPSAIRAPYGDHDAVAPWQDYGGVILDTRNDGHTGVLFLANAHNIQYDSVSDDAGSGEDSSPDFFWESATQITDHGWTLEMRIPFSSLRYRDVDPQTWGIMLYRNYTRDRHYQFFTAKQPRGGNCFICHSNTLVGLSHLPAGGHIVAAPYVNANDTATPSGDLGTPLVSRAEATIGADVKWTPNADNALDATIKPDFSQVESDVAQISANERFALFYPEKRPFFLEGIELFSTPIQAVYTRTITAPRWGARATGKEDGIGYTVLVAEDTGGGSAILPGPNDSSLASVDFSSRVFVGRARRDIGRSFVSVLATDREAGADGYNRVAGPDFQWRPIATDTVTGQWLFSATQTPNRPDVTSDWTGQRFSSHAANLQWNHNTRHLDVFSKYVDIGDGFRADTGFVPQVGYRESYNEAGWSVYPHGFVSRLRTFLIVDQQVDRTGALISRQISPGAGMDTLLSGFMRFQFLDDEVRAGTATFPRHQLYYNVQVSPSRLISQLTVNGTIGSDADFDNFRAAHAATMNATATLHPSDHLELALVDSERRLSVDEPAGEQVRLFAAHVRRLRGTYTFTARTFVRAIGQYVATERDPTLYIASVTPRDETLSGSLLFAYKVNWQSVLFVGYGDNRELTDLEQLAKADRQLFVKWSYAFQK